MLSQETAGAYWQLCPCVHGHRTHCSGGPPDPKINHCKFTKNDFRIYLSVSRLIGPCKLAAATLETTSGCSHLLLGTSLPARIPIFYLPPLWSLYPPLGPPVPILGYRGPPGPIEGRGPILTIEQRAMVPQVCP
jgi:hypothetical protein